MKPGLTKAANVNFQQLPQPKYITIRIPIVDTFHSSEQKREKMLEEIDELLNEFQAGPVDFDAAVSEAFDVMQVMTGFIIARLKEGIGPLKAFDLAESFFNEANDRHIQKIEKYALERGWMVVHE